MDSVTYEPTRFGKSDYIDNDCDGHVDEELCVGESLNRGEMSAYPYHELEFEPGPLTGFYEQSRNMQIEVPVKYKSFPPFVTENPTPNRYKTIQ